MIVGMYLFVSTPTVDMRDMISLRI
jgi:hypothetical protein